MKFCELGSIGQFKRLPFRAKHIAIRLRALRGAEATKCPTFRATNIAFRRRAIRGAVDCRAMSGKPGLFKVQRGTITTGERAGNLEEEGKGREGKGRGMAKLDGRSPKQEERKYVIDSYGENLKFDISHHVRVCVVI